jgi:hypothetical protein
MRNIAAASFVAARVDNVRAVSRHASGNAFLQRWRAKVGIEQMLADFAVRARTVPHPAVCP